jgi:hypothetical protein
MVLDRWVVGSALASAVCLFGCSKPPPEPGKDAGPSASASPSTSSSESPIASYRRLMHDRPRSKPPLEDPDAGPPVPLREPDWDLDEDDPWHDYAQRYVQATRRYGDATDCAVIGTGQGEGGKRNVEVRGNPGGSCGAATPKTDAVIDVLVVDVASDRLSVDDSNKRPSLRKWPDGSDPEGPPKPVRQVDDLHGWKSTVHDMLRELQLTAIRGQLYGRGTYPVLTLAGWHGPILRTMTPEQIKPAADKLCAANGGGRMGIVAGLDRSIILRIRCGSEGANTRWEKL